ncbi:actin-like ATPase domain-containing protein [Coniophora puteana RWD-64-598 SS2]|uniref:Xylulose kinase n=1 Tax=Coniophora puteana (strain RWD-64-598) TaxID=741705 RepID=A0A5M3ML77_CONPW|nr:actin-like ATPase domain-containing protein [Coniophora puteana RWD-64-598 SS2]EIW79321.1 actin-like ATPase domain-containing protein [Coniophora puteana RWD-64-598 SS2]
MSSPSPSDYEGPLFLGLDLSTQQLKAVLVAEDASVVHESSVHFDSDLPHYGTTNGAVRGPAPGEVTSPVRMWLEAIDLVMTRVRAAGVDLSAIRAVSGAGQQHGSVYWSEEGEGLLTNLDPARPLGEEGHLAPRAFSLSRAPIWQDSSNTAECRALERLAGDAQALADQTGSRAYERFTGPQIMRIRRVYADAYARTSRISLVSSWIASIFLGGVAPIEISDASGMNTMDVLTCKWSDALLEACGGPELRSKLGPEPVRGGTNLGPVSSWWVKRWGFSPDCIVAPFTGDNPATIVSFSQPGDALLSLGTSTTLLLSIPPSSNAPARFTNSHLLTHPTDPPHAFIAMLCYKNGALAREHVRDAHSDRSWDTYNTQVRNTPPGCDGRMGFYFPLPEIIPPGVQGDHFFSYSTKDGSASEHQTTQLALEDVPRDAHARLILESQLLSIRSRIDAIMPAGGPPLQRLIVTGGASGNPAIRQAAADILGLRAYVARSAQGAGMGGALLARWAWWRVEGGYTGEHDGSFEEMRMAYAEEGDVVEVAAPKKDVTKKYEALVAPYRACEAAIVANCAKLAN